MQFLFGVNAVFLYFNQPQVLVPVLVCHRKKLIKPIETFTNFVSFQPFVVFHVTGEVEFVHRDEL